VAEGSFGQSLGEDLDFRIGTSYALYDENRFTLDEEFDVRIAYARVDYDILEDVRLLLQYEIEENDIDTFHLVEIGIRYRF